MEAKKEVTVEAATQVYSPETDKVCYNLGNAPSWWECYCNKG